MTAPAEPTAYCVNCMAQRKVNMRRFADYHAVVLMTCQGCGHWIKCPRCMAIRSETHECAQ